MSTAASRPGDEIAARPARSAARSRFDTAAGNGDAMSLPHASVAAGAFGTTAGDGTTAVLGTAVADGMADWLMEAVGLAEVAADAADVGATVPQPDSASETTAVAAASERRRGLMRLDPPGWPRRPI
jgi:hypothetical protein